MRISPLEIQSHRFGRRLNGFDPEEVEAFLRMVTEDYEAILKENESQRSRIAQLEDRVDGLAAQEKLLQETLLNAQSMSEKMREVARKECDALLTEAELRAEKIIDASHRRAARLAENIRELRGLRARIAESLRAVIDTQLGLIDGLTEDPIGGEPLVEGMVEGKIAYLGQAKDGTRATTASDAEERPPAKDSSGSA
jgi:cell division initiation protein